MPATQARGGFGTALWVDDGSGTFVKVAEVLDINGLGISQIVEDATNMDSPEGWSEAIAVGVKETSDVTFQMHMLQDDTSQNLLHGLVGSSSKRNYRLVFPSLTKRWAFAAFVQNIGAAYPVKGKMVNDVTIKITGKPVKEAHS